MSRSRVSRIQKQPSDRPIHLKTPLPPIKSRKQTVRRLREALAFKGAFDPSKLTRKGGSKKRKTAKKKSWFFW
jgi:hypothetical protein